MSDESPLRFEPIVYGAPDPPASPPLPQAQAEAQQRIDAIFADPGHAYHRGDDAAVQEVLRLHRIRYPADQTHGPHMERGAFVTFQTIGEQPAPTLAADDAPPDQAALPATPAAAFIAAAPEIGIQPEEAKAWATWAETKPSGGTLQEALIGWPEDAHDEITELAELGWKALNVPLSVRATAELHGLHYRAKAFNALVKRGLAIQEKQKAEQLGLTEERPGSAALNDPARRLR
jgi:hypothetical protein